MGRALKSYHHVGRCKLKLLTANRDETLQHLRSGSAHIGVTVMSELPDDLWGSVIRRIKPVLVVHETHELATQKRIAIDKLRELDLIAPPEPSDLRATLTALCREFGFTPKIAVEASGWELMTHFVSLQLGAAVVNSCCRLRKGLIGIPITEMPSTDYYLVHRREQYVFDELQLLKREIIREVNNEEIF